MAANTTTATGSNPYGDEAGLAPNWDYKTQQINSAYNDSLTQLNTNNNTMFQSYGINHTNPGVTLGQAMGSTDAANQYTDYTVDPNAQYGQIQTLNRSQGGSIQQLMNQGIARNAGQFGMSRQQEGAARFAAGQDQTKLLQGLFTGEQGILQGGADALKTKNTGQAGIDQNQAAFKGWADTHYVSEGGDKPDPIDTPLAAPSQYSSVVTGINQLFSSMPKGQQASLSQLGRIRDQLRQLTSLQGYNKGDAQKLIDQYTQQLHANKALYYSKNWQIKGYDPTGHTDPRIKPAKTSAKKTTKPSSGGAQAGGASGYTLPGK